MTNRERAKEIVPDSCQQSGILIGAIILIREAIERALDEAEKRGWGTVNVTFKDAYREGQREMRERSAKIVDNHYWDSLSYEGIGKKHGDSIVGMIHALPIQGETLDCEKPVEGE